MKRFKYKVAKATLKEHGAKLAYNLIGFQPKNIKNTMEGCAITMLVLHHTGSPKKASKVLWKHRDKIAKITGYAPSYLCGLEEGFDQIGRSILVPSTIINGKQYAKGWNDGYELRALAAKEVHS